MIAPLVATLALVASATKTSPREAPVALTFAWPDGVEATRTEEAELDGPIAGERTKQTDRIRVARAAAEWRVALHLAVAPGVPVTFVAGTDGAVARLEGADEFQAAVLAGMNRESLLPTLLGFREEQKKFVAGLVDQERERWAKDVARWAGKTLVPGDTREEVRPSANARSLPARVRFGLRRRLPCPDAPGRACVELWLTEEPDEAARRLACASPVPSTRDSFKAESSELVVVAEPDTLLPHRSTGSTTSKAACEGALSPGPATTRHARTYTWRR